MKSTGYVALICGVAGCLMLPAVGAGAKVTKHFYGPFKNWLDQDVAYIITDEERQAFARLRTDEERRAFIEQFWLRRDPTPESIENEFKEGHYRRIGYANARFAHATVPGWKADRGRIYIEFGPPDDIESQGNREIWRYRCIEGGGESIHFDFVDGGLSGNAPILIPKATLYESLISNYHPCFPSTPANLHEFERLAQFTGPKPGRPSLFLGLEQIVKENAQYSALPMKVRIDFFKLTDATVLTPITVSFANRSTFAIYGRITTPGNEVVDEFEVRTENNSYSAARLLFPGTYRLQVAAQDAGGNLVTYESRLQVPRMDRDLASSTVVLADTGIKGPYFVIGDAEIHPRWTELNYRGDSLNVFLQLYNFTIDERQRSNGAVHYQITRAGSDLAVLNSTDELQSLPNASAAQTTLRKRIDLSDLEPGAYNLIVTATDEIRKQSIRRDTPFTVQ